MTEIDPLSLDFAVRNPDSFARVLGQGDFEECERVVESLPPNRKASIIARLPAPLIDKLCESSLLRPGEWLVDAPFDDAVTLLSRIPRDRRLALLNSMDDRDRQRRLRRHQEYPAHCVGSLVGDVPLRLSAESPATDVVSQLRDLDAETQPPAVIVDADGRYLGVLDRWQLLLRNPPTGLVKNYRLGVKPVRPETPVATVAMDEQWHSRNWLPVTDHRQRVLGVVSRKKVFSAAGLHTGAGPGRSDVLLGLLADLVYVCDAVLVKALSRRNRT